MTTIRLDGDGHSIHPTKVKVCNKCYSEARGVGRTDEQIADAHGDDDTAQDRYSFGIYAGYYCATHWATSGYKGSTPETADEQFDPDYEGERLEPED